VPADDYDRVMSTLAAAGVVVVASAGNDGDGGGDRSTIAVPAQLDDVLSVGGVDRGSAWHPRASVGSTVSSSATKPDLAAPVVDIRSTGIGGGSIDTSGNPDRGFAGTSAAAPVVASLVALLVQAVHDLGGASPDLDEVQAVLPIVTRDVDVVGVDRRTGSGVPDASRIEQAAERIVEARRR
jgi:subtilisin family serine protease